jgi:hypothetical protein
MYSGAAPYLSSPSGGSRQGRTNKALGFLARSVRFLLQLRREEKEETPLIVTDNNQVLAKLQAS